MVKQILLSMLVTFVILLPVMFAVLSPFIVRKLAEMETFFATCKEGQARGITWNKKFSRFIMSYAGQCFAGELNKNLREDETDYWEVVPDTRPTHKKSFFKKLFRGIYWIGIPPFAEIPGYRMTWIEWGYPKKTDGTVSINKAPISHEETISHILVQSDVYFVRIPSAETSGGVPFDVSFLLTINITNPYKASYRIQHWLEAVTNQTEGTTRVFIGTMEASELFTVKEDTDMKTVGKFTLSPTSSVKLLKALKERFKEFKDEYGVFVELIQIQSVEPAGTDAEKFRRLLTMEYEARQNAKRVLIEADAEANKIRKVAEAQRDAAREVIGAVASIPGGAEIYHSQQVGSLPNLTTYVEGGKRKGGPVISVPINIGKK
jgi:regulator of protease activity HflC (stomatin/prohibitin superfamily)